MRQHFIFCDKCDAEGELRLREFLIGTYIGFEMPRGWAIIREKDFCPVCAKFIKKHIDIAFNEGIR